MSDLNHSGSDNPNGLPRAPQASSNPMDNDEF